MARYAGSCAAVRRAETPGRAPEDRGGAAHELLPEERLSIMSIRVREERYILSSFWSMGRAAGAGTTLAIDNIDKVRVGHSRSKLSRGRALSHSAAALSERKSRWALFKSSFNEAANLDEEKLEGTI